MRHLVHRPTPEHSEYTLDRVAIQCECMQLAYSALLTPSAILSYLAPASLRRGSTAQVLTSVRSEHAILLTAVLPETSTNNHPCATPFCLAVCSEQILAWKGVNKAKCVTIVTLLCRCFVTSIANRMQTRYWTQIVIEPFPTCNCVVHLLASASCALVRRIWRCGVALRRGVGSPSSCEFELRVEVAR